MKRLITGTAMLLAATSCVPAEYARVGAKRPAIVADPQILLRRLALAPLLDAPAAGTTPSGRAAPTRAAPPFSLASAGADDAARALGCLTAAVYYEARSETEDGQRAVAQVVLNRVRDRAFPPSICGVVYQGSARATGCQFSFTCDGSTRHPRDPSSWAQAQAIASAALDGAVYAPVGSATFYHADRILPWWAPSLSKVAAVGAHVFYRWRGGMERALAFRQSYAAVEPAASTPDQAPAVLARYTLADATVTVHRGQASTNATGVRVHFGRAPVPVPEQGFTVGEEDDGAI
jgi:hypothetical protein